jgi:hypothetical protein
MFFFSPAAELRSVSSIELSRHAIELEKRSIQLSLEEGNVNFRSLCLSFSFECVYGKVRSNTTLINCNMDMIRGVCMFEVGLMCTTCK